ncbi:DNA-3-methyladenine glycosylase I [Psychromarinibacter sp. C21-152]|uniref:DNA-3-methyladenine glycosylase I n=1 Tax=Psychromarinibacter sediminicola TaxID=3033385 RepID=A0AAE3NS53_9RHOB|nr:DNA-3-methyladenine glycosylase I [Psychromarinibacter sediminicola]MDF0601061.1 DNA-3-methyladenine glycosylase I [Psychromarinibacter sediminicola]
MRNFEDIYAIAADRKGGPEALEALLERPVPAEELARVPDDRWLARFAEMIFKSGFNWKVIDAKWDGFEAAFHGFDVGRCAMMDGDWLDDLLQDTRIVRHGAKIQSVRDNAVLLQDLAAEHGSAAACFAHWPSEDYVGLLELLKTRGNRLGGNTGAYALRFMGRDGFIPSRDVVARLVAEGVVDKAPTSKGAMGKVQAAFDTWRAESGRSLTEISRVLAMSVG